MTKKRSIQIVGSAELLLPISLPRANRTFHRCPVMRAILVITNRT